MDQRINRFEQIISCRSYLLWTPEIGFTEDDIPSLYRTYYNNLWDKLMKQYPKNKQLIGQELLDSISEKIKEYNQIPQKGIANDTSVRHITRRISFQEANKEKVIRDYLEEIDKSDTSMRSETRWIHHRFTSKEEEGADRPQEEDRHTEPWQVHHKDHHTDLHQIPKLYNWEKER
ncbi:hypothetical protein H5410_041304 [Solanum commersonii]|uniref:Uncharacterized protein n=1 Tax=Solanum commersonii TaxID=4109 RepID=A0A9J5XV39_SOLCO|nr:hypothetical protein H5410_041304 [Solanum commersonii]